MLPVAILAGGLATRLHPITITVPKALIEVQGKPFIHHQLNYLAAQGIREVTLCVGHFGEQIERYVGDGGRYGVSVTYSYDGEQALGTAGALIKALDFLGNEFFILYGDSYLPINYLEVQSQFFEFDCEALMVVYRNNNLYDISNSEFMSKNILRYNKRNPKKTMHHIDYGLSVVRSNLFKKYDANVFLDLADVFEDLSDKNSLFGLEAEQRFFEIGSHKGLSELENYPFLQEQS